MSGPGARGTAPAAGLAGRAWSRARPLAAGLLVAAGLAGCHRADERVLEGRPFELSGTRRFELAPPFEHARAELLVCARFEGECRPEQESTRPQLPFTARAYSGRSEGAFPLRTARSLPKRCERCLWHKGLPGGAYPWVELTAASPVRVESLRIVSLDPP